MNKAILKRIFSELIEKETNMGYTDINLFYSDIIGEYITDCFYSMPKRLIHYFLDWYLLDDIII